MLVSGIQHRDSVYIYVYFQILLLYKLLQNIEYSSLSHTIVLCWLPTLYMCIYVCIYESQPPNLSFFPLSPLVTINVFYVCESISLL